MLLIDTYTYTVTYVYINLHTKTFVYAYVYIYVHVKHICTDVHNTYVSICIVIVYVEFMYIRTKLVDQVIVVYV